MSHYHQYYFQGGQYFFTINLRLPDDLTTRQALDLLYQFKGMIE